MQDFRIVQNAKLNVSMHYMNQNRVKFSKWHIIARFDSSKNHPMTASIQRKRS